MELVICLLVKVYVFIYLIGNGEVYYLIFDLFKCNNVIEYVERFLIKLVVWCDKLKDVVGKCKVVVSNKLDSILKWEV